MLAMPGRSLREFAGSVPHALGPVRAVQNPLGIVVPRMPVHRQHHATKHDHLVYHAHALDSVEVVSAVEAGAKATSAFAQSVSSGAFQDLLIRLSKFVQSRQVDSIQERILEASGVQAFAGGKPDGGGTLSASALFPEGDWQTPCCLLRQEPACELAGWWRSLRDQCRASARWREQHGAIEPVASTTDRVIDPSNRLNLPDGEADRRYSAATYHLGVHNFCGLSGPELRHRLLSRCDELIPRNPKKAPGGARAPNAD